MDTTRRRTSRKGNLHIRLLAAFCVLLLVAGVIPLYAVSLYNHPYYDDFGFSTATRQVWLATGDPLQVLAQAFRSAQGVRNTWQGTYTGTFLSNIQPGLFSESLYWLTTALLLTSFLLCFGFLLQTVFRRVLGAGRPETLAISSLALLLMTQFLPEADEAFFWFNGGIGNTFIYSLLALAAALWLRLGPAKGARAAWLTATLAVLFTLLGGGSYGGGLFGLLLCAAGVALAFAGHQRHRFAYAALTLWFLVCFLYSISAPGNVQRAALVGAHPSAFKAVLLSFYYGVALLGNYATLPVLAVGLSLAPLLWYVARRSTYRFAHPVWVLVGSICLFCAQLTPPLYGGVFLGGGRITDTYYYSFVVLGLLYETYLLGALARRRERLGQPALRLATSVRYGVLLASICLFVLGCLGYKHSDDTLYGPQNMAGGSAALSIITGEAARYDRDMTGRELLLNDTAKRTVTLQPLAAVPEVFMADLLTPGATVDVRPMLCAYYDKDAILLEGGDAP